MAEDNIQEVLQQLIRKHIREVLDEGSFLLPDGPSALEPGQSSLIITGFADALRQSGEVLYAELLIAMLHVGQESRECQKSPDNTMTINEFLSSFMAVAHDLEREDRDKYLEETLGQILLHLSRGALPSTSSFQNLGVPSAVEPCLTLHIRDTVLPVAFRDILSTFWRT